MKTIITATFILSVLLLATNCARSNSAQTLQNTNVSKTEVEANNSTNTFQNEKFAPETSLSNNSMPESVDDNSVEETEVTEKPKYAIELLMNAEYYAEEVETSVGIDKGWLGLYRKKNKYFLLPTTIEVEAVSHYLRDDENSSEMTGRKVSSNIKLPNLFLLKNADMLREGEVKTVFYGDETDLDTINRNYRRSFNFNGREYTLFVEDSSGEDGEHLTEKSKMVVAQGKTKQIIYEQEYCSDCSWNLCWVGDLDNDGELDFLLNLTSHYNSTCHVLFMSSQAKTGEILR